MDKTPTRKSFTLRHAAGILSAANTISAVAFSIKFLFVAPTLPGVYYGIVSWICAFGFAMMSIKK